MKKSLLMLLACATVACTSTNQSKNDASNTDTVKTETVNTDAVVADKEKTAEAPKVEIPHSDNIMEEVIKLFPSKELPDEIKSKKLIDLIKKKASGSDQSYEIRPNYAFFDASFGECNYIDLSLKSFKKLDGTHLVLYVCNGGCDCSMMMNHKAFVYDGAKLTEVEWPFKEPEFKECFNSISLYGVKKDAIDNAIENGEPLYNLRPEDEFLIHGMWSVCDYYEFLNYGFDIVYSWNGNTFDKLQGTARMCGDDNLGSIKIGSEMPKSLDGYNIETKAQNEDIKKALVTDSKTSEKIAEFTIENNKIKEIRVYTPTFTTDNQTKVGSLLSDILKSSSEHRAFDLENGGDELHREIIVETWHGKFTFEIQDFKITGLDDKSSFKVTEYNHEAKAKAILINGKKSKF